MNKSIEVFHPKLSYLVYKYKLFLLGVYEKLKDAFVMNIIPKKEKFSIIKDIYFFIDSYNQKYSKKIEVNQIIQGDEDDKNVINKITNYMLNLLYHLDISDQNGNSLDQKNKDEIERNNNDDNENIIKNYNEEEKYLKEFEENTEVRDENENDDSFNVDIFYPQNNNKKKGKRNYNDMIGERNELKLFRENLFFNLKKNKIKIKLLVN